MKTIEELVGELSDEEKAELLFEMSKQRLLDALDDEENFIGEDY